MCGCGAGETGGNRFCGGSQLRRSGSAEGGKPFVPGCRGGSALLGQGAKPIGRVQGGSACAECRGGEPLLRCPEVENLGPGKVDACVNLYWVLPDADFRRICGFAALPRLRN